MERLQQQPAAPAACSLPRALRSALASTSSRRCVVVHQQQQQQQRRQRGRVVVTAAASYSSSSWSSSSRAPSCSRRLQQQQPQQHLRRPLQPLLRLPPPRVTGTREEYDLARLQDPEELWGEEAEGEDIEVDTLPIWDPEKGAVGERVFADAEEEKERKDISIEDTAYWFADPGAATMPRSHVLPAAQEIEVEMADEELELPDEPGFPPRLRLSDLEVGDELCGIVTDLWLWHGAFVDVLANYKGLVPISETEWTDELNDLLFPGTEVRLRVAALPEFPKHRWPLVLQLVEPAEAAALIAPAGQFRVPANLGWCFDQGWEVDQVAKELNRPYHDTVVPLEPDHGDWADNEKFCFGWDAPDGEYYYDGSWLDRELQDDALQGLKDKMATGGRESGAVS